MPSQERLSQIFLLVVVTVGASNCFADTDIAVSTTTHTAVLGSGYRTDTQSIVGRCLQGPGTPTGQAVASFTFSQSLSEARANEELGITAGGRAQVAAVNASATATFFRNSVTNKYSASAIWLSEYQVPTPKLVSADYSDIGNGVKSLDDRWGETCGDEYVEEITRGARLFFSIRVEFMSEEEKQKFEASFSLSGPLFSAGGTLKQASDHFSSGSKIIVTALQIGGDVSKITQLFGKNADTKDANTNGPLAVRDCSLGDFARCSDMISTALSYAADTANGFPSQIAPGAVPGAADLVYKTSKYAQAGIRPRWSPQLTVAIKNAREKLAKLFKDQLQQSVLEERLEALPSGSDRRGALESAKDTTQANIDTLVTVSNVCYDTPPDCPQRVGGLHLASVDPRVLSLPSLPTASYRLMGTQSGILSRADSVQKMVPRTFVVGTPARRPTVSEVDLNGEEKSVVLRIEGVGLTEAKLYFDTTAVTTIALGGEKNTLAGKAGDGFAVIVLETTRHSPGWQDIDIKKQIDDQVAKNTTLGNGPQQSDGVFYVLVRDVFGRDTRFDIESEKWFEVHERAQICDVGPFGALIANDPDGNEQYDLIHREHRNRWWDSQSGGTSVKGTGKWTLDSNETSEECRAAPPKAVP
jgi:hypothetical protein